MEVERPGGAVSPGPAEGEVIDAGIGEPVRRVARGRADEHQRVQVRLHPCVGGTARGTEQLVSPHVLLRAESRVHARGIRRVDLLRRAPALSAHARLSTDSGDGGERDEHGEERNSGHHWSVPAGTGMRQPEIRCRGHSFLLAIPPKGAR